MRLVNTGRLFYLVLDLGSFNVVYRWMQAHCAVKPLSSGGR
jgi:hypothetical protein